MAQVVEMKVGSADAHPGLFPHAVEPAQGERRARGRAEHPRLRVSTDEPLQVVDDCAKHDAVAGAYRLAKSFVNKFARR
jgi:hypothetical protein